MYYFVFFLVGSFILSGWLLNSRRQKKRAILSLHTPLCGTTNFTPNEAACMLVLKQKYQQDQQKQHNRLHFVRFLVDHGYLTEEVE